MRLRRAAPAAAGFIAVALIALTAWLEVPVTRALGIAALIIAASMLTPVKPLDGAAIAKAGAAGASLAALGLGALAFLGKAKATVWAEASEFNAYVGAPCV